MVAAESPSASFNTQPPEGGWAMRRAVSSRALTFQHTAARRRLGQRRNAPFFSVGVSTHSRPKAAGPLKTIMQPCCTVSTHSRPKAAGYTVGLIRFSVPCFNTQPPEGGWWVCVCVIFGTIVFQHTAARRRLGISVRRNCASESFQHTAARRRLER